MTVADLSRPQPSRHALRVDSFTQWHRALATALGSTTPLAGISARSLERAAAHFRYVPHPDAWIWATLCGAELARRDARASSTPVHQGATAAELAQQAARERATARHAEVAA